ncbi:MAG: hypothetical protein KAR31_02625, partial [Candidatus Omnitrophica bacterium]|nr:hypothetical protein [Candidatus Omnitrophota bacterium]
VTGESYQMQILDFNVQKQKGTFVKGKGAAEDPSRPGHRVEEEAIFKFDYTGEKGEREIYSKGKLTEEIENQPWTSRVNLVQEINGKEGIKQTISGAVEGQITAKRVMTHRAEGPPLEGGWFKMTAENTDVKEEISAFSIDAAEYWLNGKQLISETKGLTDVVELSSDEGPSVYKLGDVAIELKGDGNRRVAFDVEGKGEGVDIISEEGDYVTIGKVKTDPDLFLSVRQRPNLNQGDGSGQVAGADGDVPYTVATIQVATITGEAVHREKKGDGTVVGMYPATAKKLTYMTNPWESTFNTPEGGTNMTPVLDGVHHFIADGVTIKPIFHGVDGQTGDLVGATTLGYEIIGGKGTSYKGVAEFRVNASFLNQIF